MKKSPKLEVVAFSFTKRCNLSCRHCQYGEMSARKRPELPLEFFVDCLRQARKLGAHSANVTGGEIFLRRNCLDLVEAGVNMGYFVTLESNGTLIRDSHISRLQALGDKVRIAISLDGMTKRTHEAVRGPNTFSRTVSTLEKLSGAGVPARINTVLQNDNIDEIPSIAEFAVEKLGIGFRLLPFILEYGKGACICKTDGVEYSQIIDVTEGFLYPFIRTHPKANITVGLNVALVPIDITGHLLCPWGQGMIGIGPDGAASLCHVTNNHSEFVFGNLTQETLSNIWNSNPRLLQFRHSNPDNLKGVCGNCLARGVCRGGCRLSAFENYRDLCAPDSQCQAVYNLGKFPKHALEHPKQRCFYENSGASEFVAASALTGRNTKVKGG